MMAEKSKKFNIKRLVLFFWLLFLGVFIGVPLYIISVNKDLWGLYGSMPSLSQLENPENDLSSRLFYANGDEMGKYFRFNRSQISYDELSKELVTTLLASEDHRFYDHTGIDLIGITRAAYGLITLKSRGGGSTITMQLAENLFKTMTENDGILLRVPLLDKVIIKTKEWIISTQLEKTFTKEEIIALYLNTVSFGSNAFGIKAAGETFFGKQPSELNYQESAVLIGLLQGTTLFNPIRNYDRSVRKRNEVLNKLARQEHLPLVELDSVKNLPIDLANYSVAGASTGLATYFRSEILWDLLAFCKERDLDLYDSGLKIYTTIDKTMQEYAEESMTWWMDSLQTVFENDWQGKNPWVDKDGKEIKDHIEKVVKRTEHYKQLAKKFGEDSDSVEIILNTPKQMRVFSWDGDIDTLMTPMDSLRYYKKFLQAGFMAMDPYTGHIKAWVGGIEHRYFKYDHVQQGKNQPGSTFKPILYATAIENGYYPCYELPDVRKSYPVIGDPPVWVPKMLTAFFQEIRLQLGAD